MSNVMVSVCCITYNQVDYIEEAIESFLRQETNFDFEIIIHDDASTDGTADVIRKYVERYPDRITAILQTKNQHSQGIKITNTILLPLAKGKYIAFCEGDDFWTDRLKLQKQFDYMEMHEECSMCMHDGWILTEDKSIIFDSSPLSKTPCKFDINDAIMGLGIKVVTNSFFWRADITSKDLPLFMQIAPTGDYGRAILCALEGYIYYDSKKMSAHRMLAKNSFSSTMGGGAKSQERWEKYLIKQEAMLYELNKYTNYQYQEVIERSKYQQFFNNYFFTRNTKKLKIEPYRTMFKKLSLKKKMEYKFPRLFGIARNIHYYFLKKCSINKQIYD